MNHKILITGRPGSGKSTLANYLLAGFGEAWAGYRTLKDGRCGAGPLFRLEAFPGGERGPISRCEEGEIHPVPETFDTLGKSCLQRALDGPENIILMDEIGRFERTSAAFLDAVNQVMHSDKTVIAVIKKEPLPHLEQLLQLPGAVIVDLDGETPGQARRRLAKLLWPHKALHWGMTLRLYGVDKSFGPGPMKLLEGVARTGSLQRAAGEMGMAYSKAWKTLKTLEDEWGFALLESSAGGAKGGSSVLTPQAEELLRRYSAMLAEVDGAAQAAFEKYFGNLNFF